MTLKVKNADVITSIVGALPLVFLAWSYATGQNPTPEAQDIVTRLVIAAVSYYVGK